MATKKKKKRLGMGLSGMLSEPVPVAVEPTQDQPGRTSPPEQGLPLAHEDGGEGLGTVPVDRIRPSRYQPRQHMDQASIDSLADSIRTSGLMQPVLVRPSGEAGEYELIAGERRWRAAQAAGLTVIPCLIRSVSEQFAAELGVIENLQREDLDAVEKADAFQRLQDEFGLTHQEIARRVGWTRAAVTNQIRLCELDPDTRSLVQKGVLTGGHGRVLLSIEDLLIRAALAKKAISEGWSVREMERQVRTIMSSNIDEKTPGTKEADRPRRAHLDDLEAQLSDHLGTRVRITANRKGYKGKLSIEFYDLDQFDGLLERVGFKSR